MPDKSCLSAAKSTKNDEFYTQYSDIENEMNAYVEYNPDVFRGKTILLPCDDPDWSNFTLYFEANFERFGLKKLISTSYAKSSCSQKLTPTEQHSPLFDAEKRATHGRLFVMKQGDQEDKFSGYLQGDGDFRSEEVTALRDEADVIITNPPFSLFREFLTWIQPEKRQFCIIGNQNAITYKEVFPLLQSNQTWLGYTHPKEFVVPTDLGIRNNLYQRNDGLTVAKFGNVCWFTNLDHGMRHQPLLLDTMAHNLKYNRKLRRKLGNTYGAIEYPRYDNYDAIEVPFIECIPSDYHGAMGVPITFMDKYCPEQFDILGFWNTGLAGEALHAKTVDAYSAGRHIHWNGPTVHEKTLYFRIIIQPKGGTAI